MSGEPHPTSKPSMGPVLSVRQAALSTQTAELAEAVVSDPVESVELPSAELAFMTEELPSAELAFMTEVFEADAAWSAAVVAMALAISAWVCCAAWFATVCFAWSAVC